MRDKASRSRDSDEEGDSDAAGKEKGTGGKKAKQPRFAPMAFAQQCMVNSELSRRDRQADMMHKRELKETELKLEEAKLEAKKRVEITRKEESKAARSSKQDKCEHGRRHNRCKECGGSGICQHGRQRKQCKECGGSSICEHGNRRSECKVCHEKSYGSCTVSQEGTGMQGRVVAFDRYAET